MQHGPLQVPEKKLQAYIMPNRPDRQKKAEELLTPENSAAEW